MENSFSVNKKTLGSFIPGTAGFAISTPNLPLPWEYIYQNRDVLLKADQYGPVYAQEAPPGGIHLFRRGEGQRYSPWLVWLQSEGVDGGLPFTNFFRPLVDARNPSLEPDGYTVEFLPHAALYHVAQGPLKITTTFFLPRQGCEIVMRCTVKNTGVKYLALRMTPALAPHVNPALMAPWDKPEWYLKTGIGLEEQAVFYTQLLSSESKAEDRRTAVLWTDHSGLATVENSLERFEGDGSFAAPGKVLAGRLDMALPEEGYGVWPENATIYGYPPVYAAEYHITLQPGESHSFTQVLAIPPQKGESWLAPMAEAKKSLRFFGSGYETELAAVEKRMAGLFERNNVKTGDKALDEYVKYWLPLQMEWVASLDRGWPTGMRGTRDSAQDYTALLFTGDFASCRAVLLSMLECQRSDGWFPRQYSAKGRHGKHDLRAYVDGGAFVLEYAWQYLAHTGDFEVLDQLLPWLDDGDEHTVLCHLLRAMEYYLRPENLGEHGLCKLCGGDWLDALNRAGVEGRGESVMVSAQVAMCLQYMADLLDHLAKGQPTTQYNLGLHPSRHGTTGSIHNVTPTPSAPTDPRSHLSDREQNCSNHKQNHNIREITSQPIGSDRELRELDRELREISREYREIAASLAVKIREAALCGKGFFRGAFTDDGKWIFSENDPDGECRPYGPANWYAVAAGILPEEGASQLINNVSKKLLGPCGYRLYAPPMGKTEITHTGRSGSGDTPPYQAENGNVYNHGSQGFLLRAEAAVGDGEALIDTLRWLLPYDQTRHPVEKSLAAPYAITNCWQESPAFPGRALMTFLTGSVAMAYRGVYEWMLGIQPALDGLVLAPVLPEEFKHIEAEFLFRGKTFRMEIENKNGKVGPNSVLDLNGKLLAPEAKSMFTGRPEFLLPLESLEEKNTIAITL